MHRVTTAGGVNDIDSGAAIASAIRCTPRERAVLCLVAEGRPRCEVARCLGMGASTVQFHLHNLFAKLGATSTLDLVYRARRQGWLS